VTKLLETGKVEAVIGVSCLSTLERSFPYMMSGAIPGLAVPLFKDGCEDTLADFEDVVRYINLKSDKKSKKSLNIEKLRSEVSSFFNRDILSDTLNIGRTKTEKIALEWLICGGKRWRPLLSIAVYKALKGNSAKISRSMRALAIAIECFHKASLVHDDIEDDDSLRYGAKTLHKKYGIPVALNIGDLLLGEGYRIISSCKFSEKDKNRIFETASKGHRELALGQGEELLLKNNKNFYSVKQIIKIFQGKTSPAFEVALLFGAIGANADDKVCQILKDFSKYLGITYQIRDDLEDFSMENENSDLSSIRLSLITALAFQFAKKNMGFEIKNIKDDNEIQMIVKKIVKEQNLERKAWEMFDF